MKCPSSIENTPQLMCLSEPRHTGLNSKATSRLTPKVPAEVGVGAEVYFFVDPRATGVKKQKWARRSSLDEVPDRLQNRMEFHAPSPRSLHLQETRYLAAQKGLLGALAHRRHPDCPTVRARRSKNIDPTPHELRHTLQTRLTAWRTASKTTSR
jgi:hypothetical protein